jgi:hypothetical protein
MQGFVKGDRIQIDCSSTSRVLSSIKNKLNGRTGTLLEVWSLDSSPLTPYGDCSVKFAQDGRKKEIVMDLNWSTFMKVGKD